MVEMEVLEVAGHHQVTDLRQGVAMEVVDLLLVMDPRQEVADHPPVTVPHRREVADPRLVMAHHLTEVEVSEEVVLAAAPHLLVTALRQAEAVALGVEVEVMVATAVGLHLLIMVLQAAGEFFHRFETFVSNLF